MTQRRGIPLVLAPFAAALFALVLASYATRDGNAPVDVYENGVAALGAAAAVAVALCTRPAWPLSIGIALGVFSSHWGTLGFPIAMDRLLIGTAIVSTLVRERWGHPGALRTRPVDWLLMVVAGYAILSAILAGTIDERQPEYALLDRFSIFGFALFFVAPKAFRAPRDRQVLLGTLVVLGGYLGVTAVLEKTGLRSLVIPRYIADPSLGIHFGRARGPFLEAAANGLALYGCLVASIVAAYFADSRRWRHAALAVAALCALGILLTLTRAVWLSASIASVAALLCARETRRFVLPTVIAGVALVVLAFAAVPGLSDSARARARERTPVYDRRNSNDAALRMIAAKPLFGFGWSTFARESGGYYRQAPDYPLSQIRNVHNVYLGNAVELGLVGGGLWLTACAIVLIGAVVRRGPPSLRPWKIGLVAIALSYGIVGLTTPLGYAFPAVLAWTWAGLAWGED